MQPQPPPSPNAAILDGLVPTNPLSAVACWTGIFGLLSCYGGIVLGPIALVTGIISLKKGALIRQSGYGKATSTARSWIGIVTGVLGMIVGIAVIVIALLKHR